jgi:hypothetical protein
MAMKKNDKQYDPNWGGKRNNAGRPSSGKKFKNLTLTVDSELLDKVRQKYPNRGELHQLGTLWLNSLLLDDNIKSDKTKQDTQAFFLTEEEYLNSLK